MGGARSGRGVALVVVGQVAGCEGPHESPGLLDGRGGQVVHRDRSAGVLDEDLYARHVYLAQHGLQRVGAGVERAQNPGIGRRQDSLTVLWDTPMASDISRCLRRRSNARRSASSTCRIGILSAGILLPGIGSQGESAARMVPSAAYRVIGLVRNE